MLFLVQPSFTLKGAAIAPAIQVQLRDDSNNVLTTATDTVTLSIGNNPGSATLGGTVSVAAVGGVATFSTVSLSAGGTGYTLIASSSGSEDAESSAFNVALFGPASQVAVTTGPPATLAPYQAFNVVVQLRDSGGLVDTTYTGPVTIDFGAKPAGDLLYHCSGNGTVVHERINAGIPAVISTVPTAFASGEVFSVKYDPAIRLIRSGDISSGFDLIDPGTGDMVRYGGGGGTLSDDLRGLVFDDLGVCYGASPFTNMLRTINLVTGVDTLTVPLTLATFTVTGCLGMDRDPLSSLYYAILKVSGPGGRRLVTVDLATGVCTLIGDTGDKVSSLSFSPTGTLYCTTGNGATIPETLWTVNKTTAAITLLLTLGAGADGEVVAVFPPRIEGPLTVNAVAGVATFTGVSVDQLGTGYTLSLTSAALTAATTSAFDVTGAVTPTATVGFAAATSSVLEGVAGGQATVTLTLSAAQTHNMPVMLSIDSTSTASGVTDHTKPLAFEVTIPAGATTFDFTIPLVNDAVIEADETVVITIRTAVLSSGIAGTTTHTLTILNDD